MTRKRATPRPISLYQRARVLLENRGVYLRGASVNGILTASNILDAIARYEGRPRPKGIELEFANRLIEAWVAAQESAISAPIVTKFGRGDLRFDREMQAQIERCDARRVGR